jgi:hypothetical protein
VLNSPIQLTLWTRFELSRVFGSDQPRSARRRRSLGTTWGPHGMSDHEQRADDRTSSESMTRHLTCGNAYSNVLGVKGSQVRILSSRRCLCRSGTVSCGETGPDRLTVYHERSYCFAVMVLPASVVVVVYDNASQRLVDVSACLSW